MLHLQNPYIPCYGSFNGPVNAGFNLTVTGYPAPGASSFSINLMDGSKHILHFNPRFPERTVVINSNSGADWGPEQRPPQFPFEHNNVFRVNFRAEPQAFKIFVNNQFLAEYYHRMPLSFIKSINVTGDVIIQEISTSPSPYIPVVVPAPVVPAPVVPAPMPSAPSYNQHYGRKGKFGKPNRYVPIQINGPSVPLTIQLPGNLQEGMVFNVKGAPKAGGFKISWLCSNGDKAFVFDVKFNVAQGQRYSPSSVNKILRNSFQFGAAGAEESAVPFFPFVVSMNFDLDVKCQSNFYEIKVNGQPLLSFNHRIYPVDTVSSFMIEGGLTLSSVSVRR